MPIFLQFNFCYFVSQGALIILHQLTLKHIQESAYASEIDILPDPKNHNFTIAKNCKCQHGLLMLVCLCVRVIVHIGKNCDFLAFSYPLDIMWCALPAKCNKKFSSITCHTLSFLVKVKVIGEKNDTNFELGIGVKWYRFAIDVLFEWPLRVKCACQYISYTSYFVYILYI